MRTIARDKSWPTCRFVVYPYRLALAGKKKNILRKPRKASCRVFMRAKVSGDISALLTQKGELMSIPRKRVLYRRIKREIKDKTMTRFCDRGSWYMAPKYFVFGGGCCFNCLFFFTSSFLKKVFCFAYLSIRRTGVYRTESVVPLNKAAVFVFIWHSGVLSQR